MFFSLRNKLFLVFTCLLTIPFLILSLVIPGVFTNYIKNQTQDLTVEMMDQFSLYINSITMQAADIGQQVLVNPITQDWIRTEAKHNDMDTLSTAKLLARNELNTLLSSMTVNNSNSISVSIFTHNGEGIWGKYTNLENIDWYSDFINYNKTYTHSHIDANQQSALMRDKNINSHLIPLVDLNSLEDRGVIKVNFSTDLIEESLNKITTGEHGNTFIVDEEGTNILTGEIKTPSHIIAKTLTEINDIRKEQGLVEIDGSNEEYLLFYQRLSVGDWILLSEVTKEDLFSKPNRLQRSLLLLSAGLFFITIIASFLFSSSITNPLRELTKAMNHLEKGDFQSVQRVMPTIKSQNNEIRYMLNVFTHTIDRLKSLIDSEFKLNIRRRNAEYKALLLQINPHFLNNTLEIIGGLAAQGKNKDVMNVSVYLGRMLRYSLDTKSDIVTLGEEIQYIRNYATILQLRYEKDLQITIDEDPKSKSLPITKFVLQPLVENAVKYSLISKNHALVNIETYFVNDRLTMVVEDDGIGISEEVILNLTDNDKNSNNLNVLESSGNSIGLKNVISRLRLHYGDQFSYHIDTKENKGTRIVLSIDFKRGA
ncbi:HAMP domain-containing protein [Gracilibacillus oryzae]|uniref:histidine kinase n=1 Tax=Gracilibacillus oryzae TaxID=1672701 RepID=A0A7C8GQ55_9BACI|nr:sensor histidine kinase [Gracilibacillus oryzae]KAB8125922.1 HAMP domain-containing protein [Gracilibacillus oryzae]